MIEMLVNIVNDIHTILYPRLCFGCNAHLVFSERLICTVCRHQLPLTDDHLQKNNATERIFFGRIRVKRANSFLFYSKKGIVQQLIHHLKYKNQQKIGSELGHWYGHILKAHQHYSDVDFLVIVPLHAKKLKSRGYNQVNSFAKALSAELKLPFIENILTKSYSSSSQTLKTRIKRWMDAEEIFHVDTSVDLQNKHILIVDDIITTGATMEACVNAFPKDKNVKFSLISMALSV